MIKAIHLLCLLCSNIVQCNIIVLLFIGYWNLNHNLQALVTTQNVRLSFGTVQEILSKLNIRIFSAQRFITLSHFVILKSPITFHNCFYCIFSSYRFESCWPALIKDSSGVVIVFNPDIPSHLKEIETWHSMFISSQVLQDNQCLLMAHHKPGSAVEDGRLPLGISTAGLPKLSYELL